VNSESLHEATVKGIRWLAAMRVASEAVGFIAAIVLARLVSPGEFGRAAVALIFIMLSVMLTFEGFASALVQRESVTEADRRDAMLMSLVGGTILTLVVYALPVWRPLFGSRTTELIQLSSPAMFIAALGGVSRASVWRKLDFRRVSTIDAASIVVGSSVAIPLAAGGLGAKAIVIGGLAQTATTTALLLALEPPPLPGWVGSSQRQLLAFGVPAAFAALVDTLFRNIDYAILATRLPAASVGFYYRAFNVGVVYQDKLSRIMTQIGFPVYARVADREEMQRLHERVARLHAVVIFPLLASMAVLAPVVVPLVFGPAWKPAVVPTQILLVAGMVAAIMTGYPQLMLAIGRPRALLNFNLVMLIGYGTAIFLASRHGLIVVSITASASYLAILVGVYRFLLGRYAGISLRRLAPELGPAVISCIGLVAVALPLTALLKPMWPRPLTIVLVGPAGLIVYALVLRTLFPAAWSDCRVFLLRVFPFLGRIRRRDRLRTSAVSP